MKWKFAIPTLVMCSCAKCLSFCPTGLRYCQAINAVGSLCLLGRILWYSGNSRVFRKEKGRRYGNWQWWKISGTYEAVILVINFQTHFKELGHFLCYCLEINDIRSQQWLVNTGLGAFSSGNKPLPHPKLTQIYLAIWCSKQHWVNFSNSVKYSDYR